MTVIYGFFSLLMCWFTYYNLCASDLQIGSIVINSVWRSRSVQRRISAVLVAWFWRIVLSPAESVTSPFCCFTFQWKEVREMTTVNLRNNESQDSLLKRFRKKVVKSGVLSTVRRKRWFVSKSEQRRMDRKKAMRRMKRRQYTRETE